MMLLLVFIYLKSGMLEVKPSIYAGTVEDCQVNLPLMIHLYKKHGFYDGPKVEDIRKVTGRCEPVDPDNKVAKNEER